MLKRRSESGDTLIEVLFAITVFALIVVSSLSIMNQGVATSQRALELSLVRQQMDAQADTLRFLQSSYVQAYGAGITYNASDPASPAKEYYKIIQQVRTVTSASQFGTVPCGTPPTNSFILNTRLATVETTATVFKYPTTFAQLKYNNTTNQLLIPGGSEGLWIEGVRSSQTGNNGYIDFHIRACWDAPGLKEPMNLGTIVRLYEPRG